MGAAEQPSGLRVLSLIGSVTAPGRLRRAVEEASERLRPLVADLELIDLGELRVSFADGREPGSFLDDTAAVVEAIERADVVTFATPVYRGSMTGALKNVFDLLPVPALRGKVVAFVAMGASDHHSSAPTGTGATCSRSSVPCRRRPPPTSPERTSRTAHRASGLPRRLTN